MFLGASPQLDTVVLAVSEFPIEMDAFKLS